MCFFVTPRHRCVIMHEGVDESLRKISNCCGASIASEQQHKQDLKRMYGRGYEFITFYQNALHLTRAHSATFYQSALHHEEFEDVTTDVTPHVTPLGRRPFSRGF